MSVDIQEATIVLRDRSLLDVFDLAVRFVVRHRRSYAMVALVWLVPLVAVPLAVGASAGWGWSWLATLPLLAVAEVPFTVLASRLVFEDNVRTREVTGAALRSLPRILVLRVFGAVAATLGLAMMVVPSFFAFLFLLFVTEAVLLERSSMGGAISRSLRVVSSAMSDAFLGVIVLGLLAVATVFLADIAGRTLIGEVLEFRTPAPLWTAGGSALATLGLFAVTPFLTTARFLLYLNVRTRVEGWDIQTRFNALAARTRETETTAAA